MTKAEALYSFFSSFGISAYASASVPDDVELPYLTYELTLGNWLDENNIPVHLWYYTTKESVPNAKVQQISDSLGMSGKIIQCEGGALWLKRGNPWSQSIVVEGEPNVKHRYLTIDVETLSNK